MRGRNIESLVSAHFWSAEDRLCLTEIRIILSIVVRNVFERLSIAK